jgi:trimeric autotransporter adhesin
VTWLSTEPGGRPLKAVLWTGEFGIAWGHEFETTVFGSNIGGLVMSASNLGRVMVGILVLVGLCGPKASAQCAEQWLPGEGMAGVDGDGSVIASVTWDPDGAGPKDSVLVVAGGFWSAGDVSAPGIAAWDGERWSAVSSSGGGQALAVYNGDLIAAAGTGVRRFDVLTGTWQVLGGGMNHMVRALTVHNGELIAAGFFTSAGGEAANHVARWNGTAWSPIGSGLPDAMIALTVHNGNLIAASGAGVHRWNGTSWQQLGPTISVESLAVYNNELIAGGPFRIVSGGPANHIARWDGQAWQPLGSGMNDSVFSMTVYNGELIAGGLFSRAGGISVLKLARWDGSSWSSVGGGGLLQVWTLKVYKGELYVGGHVSNFDGTRLASIARWNGANWGGFGTDMNGPAFAFAEFRGDLYMGGYFSSVRGTAASGIARRAGTGPGGGGWHPVGSGVDGFVRSMAVFENNLFVSGSFTTAGGVPADGVARFDGATWFAVAGPGGGKLHVHDGSLYITGDFPPSRVARFDGELWQPVGSLGPNLFIGELTSHNGELIAGGNTGIGGSVFRWDGVEWHIMGLPQGTAINALVSFNGTLIAGGTGPINRWDGTSWVDIGGALSPLVNDLAVRNNELIVAGAFTLASNQSVRHIARWNGSTWLPLGGGVGFEGAVVEDSVVALGEYKGELLAGGWFTTVDGRPNAFWAHWGCGCYANCDRSTSAPVLNVQDFTCFLQRYAAGDAYANCDGSATPPVLSVSDFTCFLQRYAAGCP